MKVFLLLRLRYRMGQVILPLGITLVLLALFAGCTRRLTGNFPSTGSYPADLFTEMHYQQSFRSQESPRLAPATSSVPITGAEVAYEREEYARLPNPFPRTAEGLAHAAEVFRVNCSMCHGLQAKGDGRVGDVLALNQYTRPPDLTAETTRNRTDGEIFGLMSEGVFVMPRFKSLLTARDRWLLVHYLRQLQSR